MKSTPSLCDEYPDLVSVLEPILFNFGGNEQFSGGIVTVKCFEDNSHVRELVSQSGKGRVLVVDVSASMRCAYLGDRLAQQASDNGWSGIVIYDCIRDIDEIRMIDIGVQALGIHPMKTQKKGAGKINMPITFGGVIFNPEDYLYADNNGIIVSSIPLGQVPIDRNI